MSKELTPEREKICRLMVKAREKAGIGKTEMARRLGVQYADVHRWENGINAFPPEVIVKYATICEKNITITPMQ